VVITPWFINLLLLAGGGRLWGDIPAGERRYVSLPCGTLQFIADDDPDLGPYQYCPLIAPVSSVPDMAVARQAAAEALQTVFATPPAEPEGTEPGTAAAPPTPVSRRGFFRRLAGRQV
jgi:[NiFe] hydrogenase assembly HybE family chaperone